MRLRLRADADRAAGVLRPGSRHPLVVCPGNHDDRAAFRAVFGDGLLDEPPALAFHGIGDDRRLTTHYRVVAARR